MDYSSSSFFHISDSVRSSRPTLNDTVFSPRPMEGIALSWDKLPAAKVKGGAAEDILRDCDFSYIC